MTTSSSFNDYDAPLELEPLSWSQAWTMALFSPSNETYARIAYDPQASVWRAGSWLFITSLIGFLIGTPISLVVNPEQLAPMQDMLGESGDMLIGVIGLMLCLVPLGAFFSVIGAMISAAIYQLIAQLLGGRGNFAAMFTAFAAFGAPLSLVTGIASAIPFVNLCITLPLGLYAFVLSIIAVDAVNRFGMGKAVLTILLPTLVLTMCCCLAIFAMSATLAPVLGDPANWQQFLTPVP